MNQSTSSIQVLIEENQSLKMTISILVACYVILEDEYALVKKENEKIIQEFEEYRVRHPQHVGVKHGKAYDLKLEKEDRSEGTDIDTRSNPPKKIGAQPGHKKQVRVKQEIFQREVDVDVHECPHCGSYDLSDIQEERYRFIDDIPLQSPITTKYSIKRRYCPHCKKIVKGL
ncbi:MAG: IS66 family transposase zinc-finger binding domain-containing protein [Methanospirillaceae archaeon]|nr:IS66 family transposase zinc-finger binding domain-containing protein [Methanospirillaceae archaeon]